MNELSPIEMITLGISICVVSLALLLILKDKLKK